jgi:hypothetical protein
METRLFGSFIKFFLIFMQDSGYNLREVLAGKASDAFLAGEAGGEDGTKHKTGAQLVPALDVLFGGPGFDTPSLRFDGAQRFQAFAQIFLRAHEAGAVPCNLPKDKKIGTCFLRPRVCQADGCVSISMSIQHAVQSKLGRQPMYALLSNAGNRQPVWLLSAKNGGRSWFWQDQGLYQWMLTVRRANDFPKRPIA